MCFEQIEADDFAFFYDPLQQISVGADAKKIVLSSRPCKILTVTNARKDKTMMITLSLSLSLSNQKKFILEIPSGIH